jgi:hypothetical protein
MESQVPVMPRTFSVIVFLTMLLVFAASAIVFHFLSLRWTRDRRRTEIEDWAKEHGFRLRFAPDTVLPPALQSLSSLNAQVEVSLVGESLQLIRVATSHKWNILIRETDAAKAPAGLRPLGRSLSFLDLFSLTDFPTLMTSERFVVTAADSKAAREMANSPARGLLPADIGLLVHGRFMTLDFSSRPFDTIEFERMLAVMEQLVAHLPSQAKVST